MIYASYRLPQGVGDVGDGEDLVFSFCGEPHDAAVDYGQADVLKHQGIEAELYGVEAEVLLYHVAERWQQRAPEATVVLVLKAGVGLIVQYDEAGFGAVALSVIIV